MEHYYRRGIPPWAWVLIVLAALILVFVVYWAIVASTREPTVIVPPAEREETPPIEQPQQPTLPPSQQPVVVERERPITIYVERDQTPRVIIVPQGEQPPEARQNLVEADLPGMFRYQDRDWAPSDRAVMGDRYALKKTGASVDGRDIYVMQDAIPPYDEVYLKVSDVSDVYVSYTPSG